MKSSRVIGTNIIVLVYFIYMGKSEDFITGYITSTSGMITAFIYYKMVHNESH